MKRTVSHILLPAILTVLLTATTADAAPATTFTLNVPVEEESTAENETPQDTDDTDREHTLQGDPVSPPSTGDYAGTGLWVFLALGSGAACLFIRRKINQKV